MESQRPGRNAAKGDAWNWVKTEQGKPLRGWLAGPIFGVKCHHFKGTRGCSSLLTGGKVKCGHDHDRYAPEWKGFVPWWDELGVRCFVIICEAWLELAEQIPHLGELWIIKTSFHGSPIKVHAKPWAREDPPISTVNKKPQDIRPFLLRLWGDKDLSAHFRKHPMKPLAPIPPAMYAAAHLRAEITAEVKARQTAAGPPLVGDILKTFDHPNGTARKGGHS